MEVKDNGKENEEEEWVKRRRWKKRIMERKMRSKRG